MPRRPVLGRRALLGGGLALAGLGLAGCGWSPLDRSPVNTVPVAEPEIIDTAAWGARAPARLPEVRRRRPNLIVVHHTAGSNAEDYSAEHAIDLARGIQRHHMDTQGWSDTGQHFTVSRGGHTLEGRTGTLTRAREGTSFVIGSHAYGANGESLGIENEGTYDDVEMPAAQWTALVSLTAWLCARHRIDVEGIVGHRDVTSTGCPGEWLYGQLPQLRTEVQAVLTGA